MAAHGIDDWKPVGPFPPLTKAERSSRLAEVLSRRPTDGTLWLFAYGSLIWDPGFCFVERRRARVEGYVRAMCMWSTQARGTAERPGLGLGLVAGAGDCHGVVYRLDPAGEALALDAVWEREMVTGIYSADWLRATTAEGTVVALAFVVQPKHPQYAQIGSEDLRAAIVRAAAGTRGRCRDYLASTVAALRDMGVDDPALSLLLQRVDSS